MFDPQVPGLQNVIGATDIGTGFTFRSAPAAAGAGYVRCYCYTQPTIKTSVAYVTGAHVAKFGMQYEWGSSNVDNFVVGQSVSYTLQNAVPRSLTMVLTPRSEWEKYRDLGLYAQDQWTIRRLTVNAGVRFDYHNEWVPDQTSGPGRFGPLQS